jgi:hypothetical protein
VLEVIAKTDEVTGISFSKSADSKYLEKKLDV